MGSSGYLPYPVGRVRFHFCRGGGGERDLKRKKKGRKKEGNFMSLEVVYLSPQALTPYEGNARKHNPEDIEQIKESILADGFNDPIGIWGSNNLIVEGHGRQIAAKELGLDKVPCIRLDHLTDTQRRDYAIRHNRTAELSGWDFGKLEEEIARLEIEGVDLSGLKFTFGGDFGSDDEYLKEQTEPEAKQGKTCTCPSCGFTFETL